MTTRSPGRYSWTKYGPAEGNAPTPSALGGQVRRDGAEERHRRARREVGSGLGEADDRACSRARRPPRAVRRRPASTSRRADDVPRVLGARRVDERLQAVRSIASANAFARTGVPSLKRKPFRSVNVYVLKSFETR